jgi:hypothetical protein
VGWRWRIPLKADSDSASINAGKGRKQTSQSRARSGNSFGFHLNGVSCFRSGVWAGLDHAVMTNMQPGVRIDCQSLEQCLQLWPQAVSTKRSD